MEGREGLRTGVHDTGGATGLINPGGAPQPLLLTLHNPNSVPIYVSALAVTVTNDPNGCSRGDVAIEQADLSTATSAPNEIVVPANGSVTLPAQGVDAPTIRLLDTGVDQGPACANQTFELDYDGSAHS